MFNLKHRIDNVVRGTPRERCLNLVKLAQYGYYNTFGKGKLHYHPAKFKSKVHFEDPHKTLKEISNTIFGTNYKEYIPPNEPAEFRSYSDFANITNQPAKVDTRLRGDTNNRWKLPQPKPRPAAMSSSDVRSLYQTIYGKNWDKFYGK